MPNKKDKKAAAAARKKAEKEQGDKPALFEAVLEEAVLDEGDRKVVKMSNGRYVLLLRHRGQLHALDAACYHAGGPLHAADIEDIDGSSCIVCPLHEHAIALATGRRLERGCQHPNQLLLQRVHEVKADSGQIMIRCDVNGRAQSDQYAYHRPPGYRKPVLPGSSGEEQDTSTQTPPLNFETARVTAILPVTHNSVVLSLETESTIAGIQQLCRGTGQHIDIMHPSGVIRPYTPYWLPDDPPNTAQLLVKSYPNGLTSCWLVGLAPGDLIHFRVGRSVTQHIDSSVKSVSMIAGGTGITPMLQLIFSLMHHHSGLNIDICLIYANHAAEDIMLRDQIDALALQHESIRVVYVLSEPCEGWTGGTGHIKAELLEEHLNHPSDGAHRIFCCGPLGMHHVARQALTELGYNMDCFHEFT